MQPSIDYKCVKYMFYLHRLVVLLIDKICIINFNLKMNKVKLQDYLPKVLDPFVFSKEYGLHAYYQSLCSYGNSMLVSGDRLEGKKQQIRWDQMVMMKVGTGGGILS